MILMASGMTADTFGFLLVVAVLFAVIKGLFFSKPKKKNFYSSEREAWYDPTYYYTAIHDKRAN